MNIFKKILEKLKNMFIKKEKIAMLEEGKNSLVEERNSFKESLKVKIEKIYRKKKVETPICYGDGLGIKKKIEY